MKISLIICLYNRFDLLHKCLVAVKYQRRLPDEIIITDDGSENDPYSFVKDQAKLFNVPVRLVRQEHKGFRAARVRNNGVVASSGDLLIFLDQDIVTPPDYIQNFEKKFKGGRFLVSYPVRLSKEQSMSLDDDALENNQLKKYLTRKQLIKPIRQYYKDKLNFYLYIFHLANYGAKLRSGVTGILREDYIKVNGFDENFIGWGNEDDDLGRRLLASGCIGINVTKATFPLHLYHEPHHINALRVNQEYAKSIRSTITRYNYKCTNGFNKDRSDLIISDFNL